MAVTDKNLQDFTNAVNSLVNQMKQRGGVGGLSPDLINSRARMGRSGAANAKSAERSGEQIEALADGLKDLHKSLKSGGKTLANHFSDIVHNMSPLKKAFKELEDVVEKVAITQGKLYAEAAKSMQEYIKAQNGNVDKIKDISSIYSEYVKTVNELTAVQKGKRRDENAIRASLAKEADLRKKLISEGIIKNNIPGNIEQYFKKLMANPKLQAGVASMKAISKDLDEINGTYKAINQVTTTFLGSLTGSFKKGQEQLDGAINGFVNSIKGAVVKDLGRIPNIVQSRLQTGFTENQYSDAFRMGMSAEELNQFRAANRDAINALTGFGKTLEKDSTESLRVWSDNAKQVGLIGKDATQYTSDWMRNAYNTGRQYTDEVNKQLTNTSQTIQQVFGGSIQESSKLIQDYNSQIYNLSKFNAANNAASQQEREKQQAAVQEEIKLRLLNAKYMGFEVEFLKQQQQSRYNAGFSDIGDRIRAAILGRVAVQSVQSQAGLSDEEARVYSLGASNSGYELNANEQKTYDAALVKMSNYDTARKKAVNDATRSGDISGMATVGLQDAVYQRLSAQAGIDRQGNTIAGQGAQARQNSRGDISFGDYVKYAEDSAKKQADSVSQFDLAVQKFSESVGGMSGLPGAAIAGAIAGSVPQILGALLKRRAATGALNTIMGGGGGGGILSSIGSSGVGQFAKAAPGKILKSGKLSIPAILGGFALDAGADSLGRETVGGAGLDVASSALSGAGIGATIGSIIPGVGTAIGGGVGALAGTGYGLIQNSKTLTGVDMTPSWDDPASILAFANPMLLASRFLSKKFGDAPKDASSSVNLGQAIDSATGIQRDALGNPIPGSEENYAKQLVDINQQQLDVAKDAKRDTSERDQRDEAIRQVESRAQQHRQLMGTMVTSMF